MDKWNLNDIYKYCWMIRYNSKILREMNKRTNEWVNECMDRLIAPFLKWQLTFFFTHFRYVIGFLIVCLLSLCVHGVTLPLWDVYKWGSNYLAWCRFPCEQKLNAGNIFRISLSGRTKDFKVSVRYTLWFRKRIVLNIPRVPSIYYWTVCFVRLEFVSSVFYGSCFEDYIVLRFTTFVNVRWRNGWLGIPWAFFQK